MLSGDIARIGFTLLNFFAAVELRRAGLHHSGSSDLIYSDFDYADQIDNYHFTDYDYSSVSSYNDESYGSSGSYGLKKCYSNEDCDKEEWCKNGRCKCDCGRHKCHGKCLDLTHDPHNCGKCGHRCHFPEKCCNGKCINPVIDNKNCGYCGIKCIPGVETCAEGICVNLQTDRQNCGGIGSVCTLLRGSLCCNGECINSNQCEDCEIDCQGPSQTCVAIGCRNLLSSKSQCGTNVSNAVPCQGNLMCSNGACVPPTDL